MSTKKSTKKRKAAVLKGERKIGRLLLIGGHEETAVLEHFVKLCGGRRGRILVCGTPSKKVIETEGDYRKRFEELGIGEVMESGILSRQHADAEELIRKVRRAKGVFFTGGDQLRLTSIIAGTPFGEEVRHRLWNEGLVVGGTSAGAAAMSSTMITGGAEKGTVRRADVNLAPGLGYWRDTVIDTHFAQRGRVSRMMVLFAQNPQILGVGLDEDTAIEVHPGDRFDVLGGGSVFVFDGTVTHTNAPEVEDDEVIAMTDSMVHVLPEKYGFDLRTKRPILPDGQQVPPRPSP